MAKKYYLPSLDGIRACAFLLVFLAHGGLQKIVPGGLGVTIFFFLSGYLITTLLRREFTATGDISIKKFYIRRCLRILPPMYLTLGLACIAVAILPAIRRPTWLGIVSALAYFYNYADILNNNTARLPAGIGVVWSLMIEEQFYFLFPIFYLTLLRSKLTRSQQGALLGSLCLAAVIWRCVLILVLHTPILTLPRWTYSATDTRFDSILWGCILAIVWNPAFRDGSPALNRNAGKLAGAGLLLMAATLAVRDPVLRETVRYSLQGIALLPIFHYCVAQPEAWCNRGLQWMPLRWIGWLSYSMYLVHEFLYAIMRSQTHLTGATAALVVFSAAVGYATLLRYLVEQPAHRLQQSLVQSKSPHMNTLLQDAGPTA